MARLARVIAVGVPHHVTQRGNARRYLLDSDADRMVYLSLLREYVELYELSLLGYGWMSNHVPLVVIARTSAALALVLKQTQGRYATDWNVSRKSSGHAWQGRFYCCRLDQAHLWAGLRYREGNPVRAGRVERAEDWRWSRAAVHGGITAPAGLLDLDPWQERWDSSRWQPSVREQDGEEEVAGIREGTPTGRPWGTAEFVAAMETDPQRCLTPQKRGRRKRPTEDRPGILVFDQKDKE